MFKFGISRRGGNRPEKLASNLDNLPLLIIKAEIKRLRDLPKKKLTAKDLRWLNFLEHHRDNFYDVIRIIGQPRVDLYYKWCAFELAKKDFLAEEQENKSSVIYFRCTIVSSYLRSAPDEIKEAAVNFLVEHIAYLNETHRLLTFGDIQKYLPFCYGKKVMELFCLSEQVVYPHDYPFFVSWIQNSELDINYKILYIEKLKKLALTKSTNDQPKSYALVWLLDIACECGLVAVGDDDKETASARCYLPHQLYEHLWSFLCENKDQLKAELYSAKKTDLHHSKHWVKFFEDHPEASFDVYSIEPIFAALHKDNTPLRLAVAKLLYPLLPFADRLKIIDLIEAEAMIHETGWFTNAQNELHEKLLEFCLQQSDELQAKEDKQASLEALYA